MTKMKFTKKNKILLLVLLIILNVVIRIPIVPHELGGDSFYIHQLSDSITNYGEAKWIVHPVQLFGFGTAPPALQILISGISQCSGINSELSILLLSFISGLFGAIAAYIFLYYVTKDDFISFLGALLFSLSPEFLRITIWTATTRSLFIALLPLLLYLLFKSINTKRLSYVILLFTIYALLMATHHMGALLLLYVCPLFILLLFKILGKLKFTEFINARTVTLLWFTSFLVLFLPVVLKLGFLKDYSFLWDTYLGGRFFEGDGLHVVPLNLVIDYAGKMGLLLPFAIIGVIGLLSKTKRSTFESYVLLLLLLVAPILGVGVYAPMLLLLIVAFLVSAGLIRFMDFKIAKKKVKTVLPIFLAAMLCFSMFMLANWGCWTGENIYEKYIDQTKNTASFIKNYSGNGTFTSNARSYAYKYSAYSGVLSAPSYVYNFRFAEKDIFKAKLNLDIKNVLEGKGQNFIILKRVGNKSANLRNPWYEFGYVWACDPDGNRELLDKYDITYCIETNFGEYKYSYVKETKLFEKMHELRPKIYDNKMEEIYFIG